MILALGVNGAILLVCFDLWVVGSTSDIETDTKEGPELNGHYKGICKCEGCRPVTF
jgi:hypothetical protein